MAALAPTSTPCVGSSSSSTRGSLRSHFASTTFCWLPPLNSSSGRSGSAGRSPIALDPSRDLARARPRRRATPGAGAGGARSRQRHVLAHAHRHHRAVGVAVAGHVGDAGARSRRAGRRRASALAADARRRRRARGSAPNSSAATCSRPGAEDARDADHLSLADLEVEVADRSAREAADAQRRLAGRAPAARRRLLERRADDQAHELARGRASATGVSATSAAVAQHDHAIGEVHHLVEAVRDEDHARPRARRRGAPP